MCGLTGYLGPAARDRSDRVGHAADRLCHRGPDDTGLLVASESVLAHRRLAIIDVAGGRQPLLNEDGGVALVCNGEIYNHGELRAALERRHIMRTRSDSEAIVHLYEDRGSDCVRDLDGMFAFVACRGGRFLAARDPLGIKPLYLGRCAADEGVWFASELKALPSACEDVVSLGPGCLLTEEGVPERWYQPAWTEPAAEPARSDPRMLADRLEAAVVKRLMSDVPLGVFLSGGLDSSVVAAIMARHVPDLHSFAVGLEGSSDLLAARRVAEHLGTRHHECVYTPDEAVAVLETVIAHLESYDPALIRSAVPCYLVSKLAAGTVKVVLTGEGADEVFSGYGYMQRLQDPRALHRECVRLLGSLHEMNLQRVDRMTMAHALEGRVPFLDAGFLDWAMALDPAEKLRRAGRPTKWLLRRAFQDELPPEILWRTKQEFAEGSGSDAILWEHGERSVRDVELGRAAELFPEDTPATKEELLYRRMFDSVLPGEARRRTVGRWNAAAASA